MIRARAVVRAGLLAGAMAAFGLEALSFARHALLGVALEAFPRAALTEQGEPAFAEFEWVSGPGGGGRWLITRWGPDRSLVSTGTADPEAFQYVQRMGRHGWGPARTVDEPTFFGPPRRLHDGPRWLLNDLRIVAPRVRWRWVDGVVVGRDATTGALLHRIGRDRSVAGDDAGEVRSFGEVVPLTRRRDASPHAAWDVLCGDADARVRIRLRRLEGAPWVSIDVESTPLAPVSEEGATGDGVDVASLRVAVTKGRVRLIDDAAVVHEDVPMDPGEVVDDVSIVRARGGAKAAWVVASRPRAVDRLAEATRFRVLTPGAEPVVHDLVWTPAGWGQHAWAGLACVPFVLRPFPLGLASFVSSVPPEGVHESSAWWIDPIVAEGRRPVLLGLAAAVAGVCGWIGLRLGRRHCATRRLAWGCAATGALFGPLGLLWLRCVVVRAAVAPVGAGVRSLALATSPSSDEPWPAPVVGRGAILRPVAESAAPSP